MPEKVRPSFSLTEETVKELKKLIPETFKDGEKNKQRTTDYDRKSNKVKAASI
jgi:hypothetical protein